MTNTETIGGAKPLYQHNQQAFDFMVDAIAAHKNCSICSPCHTGIKFAVLEVIRNLNNLSYLYLSPSMYGIYEIESHALKADINTERVSFCTYEELAQMPISEQRQLLNGKSAIFMADYLSVRYASDAKIDRFIDAVDKNTSIIGLTNIRPFFVEDDAELSERHLSMLGENVPIKETFTVLDACRHGNYEFPMYYYCDLGQDNRIKQFCSDLKADGMDAEYSRYVTHARYYASPRQEQIKFLREAFKETGAGKYVVLCKSPQTFEKDKALVESIAECGDALDTYVFEYDGSKKSENSFDDFFFSEAQNSRNILLTTVDSIIDCKVTDAVAVVFLYRIQKPWQMYQALNTALAYCRIRYKNPVIIDPYNNNATVTYVTPSTGVNAPQQELTVLFGELGTTEDQRKLYKKNETIPLLYYEKPFEATASLNRVIRECATRRVKDNDLVYFNELLDQCDKAGLKVTVSAPYSVNGIDLHHWYTRLARRAFARYVPADLPAEQFKTIRKRIEALPFSMTADTLPDELVNQNT